MRFWEFPLERPDRSALDQLMRQAAVRDVAPGHEDFGGGAGELRHRLMNGGERRPHGAGKRGVVEPGDREHARHIDPAIVRHR